MKSKILMLVVALMMVVSSVAYADALNQPVQDDTTGALTISGQIDGYGYADAFTLAVFNADKSYSTMAEYSPAEILAAMTHFGTYMTDAEGNYEVNYSTKGLSAGDYTVVLTTKDGTVYEKPIFVASRESKLKFIGEVADLVEEGCDAAQLKAKLGLDTHETVNAKVFEILEDNIIFTVDADAWSEVALANIMELEDAKALTPEEFVALLEACAKIQSVNECKINPADDPEFFGLDEAYLDTYKENVSDEDKETFVSNFEGGEFVFTSQIAAAFETCVILNVLENADSWKDYKALIETHGEDMGIDMKDYNKLSSSKKDKIADYMANSYTRIDKFVEDVNDAIEDIKSGKSSSGGSSGGGGGGGSVKGTSGITGVDITNYPIDMTPEAEAEPVKFTDIDGVQWAKEAIDALSAEGIISGIGGGQFAPEANVTREQFVKMIVSAMNMEIAEGNADFEDIEQGAWYLSYVNTAVKNGVISGTGDGKFGVGLNITRQDAAVILYRAAKLSAKGELSFTDSADIADYAKDAVKTLGNMEVISGTGDGSFAPKATCTRAQAAVMIYRLLAAIK